MLPRAQPVWLYHQPTTTEYAVVTPSTNPNHQTKAEQGWGDRWKARKVLGPFHLDGCGVVWAGAQTNRHKPGRLSSKPDAVSSLFCGPKGWKLPGETIGPGGPEQSQPEDAQKKREDRTQPEPNGEGHKHKKANDTKHLGPNPTMKPVSQSEP